MTERARRPSRIRTVLAVLFWPVVVAGWLWSSRRLTLRAKAGAAVAMTLLVAAAVAVAGAGDSSGPPAEEARTPVTRVSPGVESSTTTAGPASSTTVPSTSSPPSVPSGRATPSPSVTTSRPGSALPAGHDTTVARVSDGDTIVVDRTTRVRLIGIDTPETQDPRASVQCFGPEASRHTAELVPPGTPVRLVYDVERTDRYGRTLAYVYRLSDGLFVNLALLRDGFATMATFPPNVAHVEEFRAAERQAREASRGLWGGCPAAGATTTTTDRGVASPAPVTPGSAACDPSYPDVCVVPSPPDLDCGQIVQRNFRVVGTDPHRFDANRDGVGCES